MPRKSYTPGDFKLRVGRSRTGLGLFAEQLIPAGACVIEYTGRMLTDEEYNRSRSKYLFTVGKRVLDGTTRSNKARYINHSCVPNCEPSVHKGRVWIHALRDIQPGEELAYNYGEEYYDAYLKDICACPKCTAEREGKLAA
jgi:SET domain-containing protein